MSSENKGYTQVYTGNGKGKTTCMLGLTLRACGAGKKVYIGQFLKGDDYSEIKALHNFLPQVTVAQYGSNTGFVKKGHATKEELGAAQTGLEQALAASKGGDFDIVILDEINVAAFMELINEQDILNVIAQKAPNTELILTGRYATDKVIETADLVTEMREVKHYYNAGVPARTGIEC